MAAMSTNEKFPGVRCDSCGEYFIEGILIKDICIVRDDWVWVHCQPCSLRGVSMPLGETTLEERKAADVNENWRIEMIDAAKIFNEANQ